MTLFGEVAPETAVRLKYRGRWRETTWAQVVNSQDWSEELVDRLSHALKSGRAYWPSHGADPWILLTIEILSRET